MKVLVTGANGMLGSNLVEVLSAEHDVTGVDIEDGDLRVGEEVLRLVSNACPDIVIHTAANTDVDGCEQDGDAAYLANGIGTCHLGLACAKYNAVCMYVSTDFVFDGEKKTPYDESDRPDPINIYGRSKYMGEVLLSRVLTRHYILRTEWLYGIRGRNFVDQIIKRAAERGSLEVVNDQTGSPTLTQDLSDMIAHMVNRMPPYGVYHLTNGGACTWFEFAKTILSLVGLSDIPVLPVTQETIGRPARRPRNSAMNNLMYMHQGFPPARHWKDALIDYIQKVHGERLNLTGTSARQ